MPRLTISLPNGLYNRLSGIALQSNDSISNVINRLVHLGMHASIEPAQVKPSEVEEHCQQLIIQMNALIKNMSAEMLKFNQEDFEQLRRATIVKYNELVRS